MTDTPTDTPERAVAGLVDALARRDAAALAGYLAPEVQLRALLPRRAVERIGPEAVAAELVGWYDEVPEIVPEWTQVDAVADVWHAGLRFALRGLTPERVVEQHIYCTVRDGSITTLRLMCSGFRPVQRPERDADRQLDALGEGCATLTPRIAATMRELPAGNVLSVLTDDPSAPDGIAAWSRLTGHRLVATAAEADGTRFYLLKGDRT